MKIREKQESMIQERDNVKKELEGVQNEAGAVEKEREELSNKKQEVVRLLTSMKVWLIMGVVNMLYPHGDNAPPILVYSLRVLELIDK